MDYKVKDEFGYERNLVDQLRDTIYDNGLVIEDLDELYNIEFVNNFDIEELIISKCPNINPKLENHQIRELNLFSCGIKYLNELKLPNLEVLTILESQNKKDTITLQNFGDFKNFKELMMRCYKNLDLKLIPELQLSMLGLTQCNLKNVEQLTQFTKLDVLILPLNPNIDIVPLSKMVYIQLEPLKFLKCITFLDATRNKIQNISILHNQINYNQYYMNKQQQANEQHVSLANKLRDINVQINTLNNIRNLRSNLLFNQNKVRIIKCLQRMLCDQSKFTEYVASLFQQLIVFPDSQ
ncbi:Leucine-rich_repeat domain superfamily [Hexamita inflata]|uniref:Leucine-rich repeat domain superfamily n=1 Tax=Hexamita inflata TaxID=28002 RepID=A0AA86V2G2_9EUKA|nr:Leucine-rich repeat domain superfamily [Hexamita inflata]